MRAWTPEQVRIFLDHVAEDRLFALYRLACLTGMRRGEILGLKWSALDLDAARLTVDIALIKSPNGTVRFETPKSDRSLRTIDLDAATVAALRTHRKRQATEQLASLGAWPSEGEDLGLVFTDAAGRHIQPTNVYKQFLRRVATAGLPRVRFHDLRHTAATLLLRAGVPIHVVSERLGHASASITMDVYAHVLRDQSTDAADRLAAAIDG